MLKKWVRRGRLAISQPERIAPFFRNRAIKQLYCYYKETEKAFAGNRCLIPWNSATILANGEVIISNRCIAYSTGNVHQNTFAQIWSGVRYQNFRRELKKAGGFPACRRCCGIARS